jgi:predicted transcriptional regulator
MVRLPTSLPTLSETRALMFLIEHGPSTVRDYFEQGEHINGRAYTTIMSVMDILHSKGLATRKPEGRAYRYKAKVSLQDFRNSAVIYVIDNFFGGSIKQFQSAAKTWAKLPRKSKLPARKPSR